MVEHIIDELQKLEDKPEHQDIGDTTPTSLRLQLGQTLAALLLLSPSLFDHATAGLGAALPRLTGLLSSSSYAVRVAAAPIACALLHVSSSSGFDLVRPHIKLQLPSELQPRGDDQSDQSLQSTQSNTGGDYAATALLQLVQMASSCDTLESHLLVMLCCHGALGQHAAASGFSGSAPAVSQNPEPQHVLRLVAAAVDVLAAQRRYSAREAYLQYHAPQLLWDWFGAGMNLQQLCDIQSVMCEDDVEALPGKCDSTQRP